MAVARERLEKGTIPMTQKIYNDGVKIIGLALRSMIKVKEAQRSENEAVEMYWKKEGCGWFPPIKRTQDQIEILQNILHNIDGCHELLPLFAVTDVPGSQSPISVGSSEERTGLLRQIADLEAKLAEADKSFRAQGDSFQKAWDERKAEIDALTKERQAAVDKLIEVAEQLPPPGELTYKALCQKNDKMRQEYLQVEAENDRLRDVNNNLSLELAKQIEGSRSVIKVNEDLRAEIEGLREQRNDLLNDVNRADRIISGNKDTVKALNYELEKLRESVDAYKIVNAQHERTLMQRSEQITGLERRIAHDAEEARRHLHSSQREEASTKRQLRQAQETVDALVKTNSKVCDERDSLRKELDCVAQEFIRVMSERDKAVNRSEVIDKVLVRVQHRYNQLERIVNSEVFYPAEKMVKLRKELNKPWVDEPEQAEPPKHWDCSNVCGEAKHQVAAEAVERATKATPVDTGAVKEDILRLRVVLDTSDVSSKLNKLTEALKD